MSLKALLEKSKAAAGRSRVRPPSGFGPITLPLAAYYRGNPDRERRRAEFYRLCATHFRFDGWKQQAAPTAVAEAGRGGQRQFLEKYGHHAIASFRNNGAHPVEFFEASPRMLQDKEARAENRSIESLMDGGNRRVRLARHYHEVKLASQITPVRSVDFQGVGGGGFGPRTPADHAMSAIEEVVKLERDMPPPTRQLMIRCLFDGEFVFAKDDEAAAAEALEHLRLGLDIVAWELGEITFSDLVTTWPEYVEFTTRFR